MVDRTRCPLEVIDTDWRCCREMADDCEADKALCWAAIDDHLALANKTNESYTCTDEKEVSE